MENSKKMINESTWKLLLKFSLPAIIGLLVNALYNIIDSMFVGRGVGDLALAGVTVTFPIITTYMACIMMIGMGATSIISIKLGENKPEEAEKIMANAFVLFILMGLTLTFFGLFYLEPILIFFGASVDVLPYAADYTRIILIGSTFLALGTGMNNFIRAEGSPKVAMNTMLIGAFTNIILDYIFIFIFKWGIKGAALATVISYMVNTAWVMYHFISGNSTLNIKFENMRLRYSLVERIFIVGFPTFVLQVTASIQQLILNRKLAQYGGDTALAVIGIIMSITTFLVMPAMGISQGAQPIVGFNHGAKRYDRVKEVLTLSVISATSIVTVGFIVSKLFPYQLISLFNTNPELIEMGVYGMNIFFKFLPLVGMQMISASYFQAVGKPHQATLLSLSRQVIIFIPLLVILPKIYGLNGVWWSAPLSDIGAFILTGVWLWVEVRQLSKSVAVTESVTVS